MNKLKYFEKILLKCIIFLTIVSFFLFYLKIHSYGLPYFLNADETAGMKNLLYFYGFFSHANQKIVEPIYSALLNFFTTGFLIFFKNLFIWKLPISDLKNFFYLNPDILYSLGRLASVIFCSISLFLYFIISKKLKINVFYITFSLISLSLSFLFIDMSVVLGKNSLLLLLFLIQYYFFIKYYKKIQKFNLKAYVIFSILASLAWGINYWAATVSFYAIFYLHFVKYKFEKINYLFLFFIIFLIFGLLINIIISDDKIFHHLFNPDYLSNIDGNYSRLHFFINDLTLGLKIFYNFEKSIFFIFILIFVSSFFYYFLLEKKFLFINLFLIFEPILLFAIADYSYPQLRYFGPSFFISYILFGYIFTKILLKNNKLGFVLLFLISLNLIYFSVEKFKIILKVNNLINNNFIQYKIFDDPRYKSKSLYFSSLMTYRESLDNLIFYKELLNKKLVKLNPDADNKNSLQEIDKKISIIKNAEKNNIFPNGKVNYFFGGEYLVQDKKNFFAFIEKKFDYIIINKLDKENVDFLSTKYKIDRTYENSYLPHLRYLSLLLQDDFSLKKIQRYKFLGQTMIVFNCKEYKK